MPHRREAIETLNRYQAFWAQSEFPLLDGQQEDQAFRTFLGFIEANDDCFLRTQLKGHVTGSAFIVGKNLTHVLLTHHKKLDKWLQLGGHADGDCIPNRTAMREAQEESSLKDLTFLRWEKSFGVATSTPQPFDIDFHQIPERADEPAHIHYDFRYLVQTKAPDDIVISDESHDLKWFGLDTVKSVTDEASMTRQFDKFVWIRDNMKTA